MKLKMAEKKRMKREIKIQLLKECIELLDGRATLTDLETTCVEELQATLKHWRETLENKNE